MLEIILAVCVVLLVILLGYTNWDKLWAKPESMVRTSGVPSHPPGCRCAQCEATRTNRPNLANAGVAPTHHESKGHAAMAEHIEYFASCKDRVDPTKGMDCTSDDSRASYAVNEFGAPGLDYSDWVKAQGVDPEVRKNHAEFINERIGGAGVQGAITVGRTYSPDSNDSYDPYPWIGIRGRPQAVPVCNPTQMPDTDFDLYPVKAKMTWSSS